MSSPASGARTLLGLKIDRQIPGQQLGCPEPAVAAIAAPTTPATIAGATGLVTAAAVLYKMSTIYAGLGETAASAASTTLAVTLKIVTITPVASPTSGLPAVLGRIFYRSIDGGSYKEVQRSWVNTTAPLSDNVPAGSEGTRTPRTGTTGIAAEQTAANYGFQFIRPDTGTDFNRDDTSDKSTEQTGQLGEPRSIPGMVKYEHPFNCDARIGTLVPLLASMRGKPTAVQNAGEPVVVYGFPSSDLPSDSVSLSGIFFKGGSLRPQLFLGMKCSEIDLSLGKKQAQLKAKLTGQHDTEAGFGKALAANTGTFASMPVVRGLRSDANAYTTDSAYVKIVAAPSVTNGLGSFTIRAALAVAGSTTPTFGTAVTSTVYYDPTTKRQCHPAAIGNAMATLQQSAWIELWESTTGFALGFDVDENRKPFEVYFPGDVSLLAAGDVFEVPALQKIPGVYTTANPTGPSDDGSYTGQRPRFTFTSRMTPAHIILTRGSGSSTQTILDAQSSSLKITRPVDAVEGLGPEAANPTDVDVFGKFVLSFDVERRLIDREFERIAKSDERLYAVVKLQSHRIVVDPVAGTLSADREEASFTYAQARVDKTSSAFSGDKVTMEKITLIGEQSDDDTVIEAVDIAAKTAHSWDFSRV